MIYNQACVRLNFLPDILLGKNLAKHYKFFQHGKNRRKSCTRLNLVVRCINALFLPNMAPCGFMRTILSVKLLIISAACSSLYYNRLSFLVPQYVLFNWAFSKKSVTHTGYRTPFPQLIIPYPRKAIKTPAATADPITPEILLDIAYCRM